MDNDTIDLASGRFLNETDIRRHALECSRRFRAGKFTRVGQEFIDEVKADTESIIRELRAKCPVAVDEPLEPENTCCYTGALIDKVKTELNRLICRVIQNKVKRQPTVGITLARTR